MNYQVFISYAGPDMDLVENLREHLKRFGVTAWVYSMDRTLSEEIWTEIKNRIQSSSIVIFAVSVYSENAKGQKRELEVVLDKMQKLAGNFHFFPLALRDTPFPLFPEKLRHVNGERMSAQNVKAVAFNIARRFFPQLFEEQRAEKWNTPIPGQWLEICGIDEIVGEYFEIGDKLYFRRVSPMGLFECFAPRIDGLFWIAPEHVRPALLTDEDKDMDQKVPSIYTVMGQIQIERLGWDAWDQQMK